MADIGVIEPPEDRFPGIRAPGTYRLACGHLLHCRPLAGGALLALVECEAACPDAPADVLPLRLSDDADWPDGHPARAALLTFD